MISQQLSQIPPPALPAPLSMPEPTIALSPPPAPPSAPESTIAPLPPDISVAVPSVERTASKSDISYYLVYSSFKHLYLNSVFP
ncbi:hypothetical protein P692DRAFT_20880472 [Suillus brevipes Sb2]|nr:hypothetical protein P692DRAFT_20880472 [Suillus brevipes Sb2]